MLQLWSVRRVSLAAAMLALFAVPAVFGINLLLPASDPGVHAPDCGTGHTMILAAQAVPSAASLPCIAALPPGCSTVYAEIASGQASFELYSGSLAVGGVFQFVPGGLEELQTVTITLTATCDSGRRPADPFRPARHAPVRAPAEPGARVLRRSLLRLPRRLRDLPVRPCARRVPGRAATVGSAVAFMPRSELVSYVRRTEGLALCGRGAACPG